MGLINLAERYELRLARRPTGYARMPPGASTRRRAGSVVRETAFVEIGPVTRAASRRILRAAPVPGAADGLGSRCALVRARAHPRLAPRGPRRPADRAPGRAGRQRLLARRGGSRGARVPRRAPLPPGQRASADARRASSMRVAVVAEYYPRSDDPVLGIWAHRQALAARDGGAEVSVFVLERIAGRSGGKLRLAPREAATRIDGLDVRYVRYLSPPRPWSYAQWGLFAAPALARALRKAGPFEVIHAHNAVPAGDAVLRAGAQTPVVVSVHGGDVFWTVSRVPAGSPHGGTDVRRRATRPCQQLGDRATGAEAWRHRHTRRPPRHRPAGERRAQSAAAHRDRRAPRRAQAACGGDAGPRRHPAGALSDHRRRARARGDRTARGRARRSATGSSSPASSPIEALRPRPRRMGLRDAARWTRRSASRYIEAMAAGMPAIGCAGEPGPEEIAAAGEGIVLVAGGDRAMLYEAIRALAARRGAARRAWRAARADRRARASRWQSCGEQTRRRLPGGRCDEARAVRHRTRAGRAAREPSRRCTQRPALSSRSSVDATSTGRPGAAAGRVDAREVRQREIGGSLQAGEYGAVDRRHWRPRALPIAWRAAQRSGVPFIFWAALWRTPTNPGASRRAGADARASIARADAVVTYGRARQRATSPRTARRGLRRAPGSRQRLLGRRRRRRPATSASSRCSSGARTRRRAWRWSSRLGGKPRSEPERPSVVLVGATPSICPASALCRPRRTRTAQPLRSRARSGHGFRQNAQVRRAVGACCERGHEPGSGDHRQRRRRCGRRRASAQRAQRADRTRRATGGARTSIATPVRGPRLCAGLARTGAKTSRATPTRRGHRPSSSAVELVSADAKAGSVEL